MELLRMIIVFGIITIIGTSLQLKLKNVLRFYNKMFPYPILREGAIYDNLKPGDLTYEGQVIHLAVSASISLFPFLFLSEFNYFFNLGAYLVFVLPALMILSRIKTFSDDNILFETGLGYEPLKCWVLSFLCLVMGLAIGFSQFYFNHIPFYVPLIIITLALMSSLIPIFPDKINKHLSYDIRSEKGMWTLKIFVAIAIFIQSLVFLCFSLIVL
jgi:hypothetical protein